MTGDFSRLTFNKKKHFCSVRMQQGRITLDSDLNELEDIARYRDETETFDTIGPCGAPMHNSGFHIVKGVSELSAEESNLPENANPPALSDATDFFISGGRYYVDGILVESEHISGFHSQPDFTAPGHFSDPWPLQNGTYLAYIDVWQRHLTALEDPDLREVALGGPDTTTRLKTVWQVKLKRMGNLIATVHCLSALGINPPNGKMAARVEDPGPDPNNPCRINPAAGYRRLENQLYRVEVHKGGPRGTASFKWSRDNGSIVMRWEQQSGDDITVSSPGRDTVLGFAPGMWIELTDDEHELSGIPGTLVQIIKINERIITIDPATAGGDPTNLSAFGTNPKVRRWDSNGVIIPTNADWKKLEEGIEVQFSNGTYKTGDYWFIPARTITGKIEWPVKGPSNTPVLLAPYGITHHYCRLAVMKWDGSAWTEITDCRNLFPSLTEQMSLYYGGGDGQEDLPGQELDEPFKVGVAMGKWPVEGARVRFSRVSASPGELLGGLPTEEPGGNATTRIIITGSDGIAECRFRLGGYPGTVTHEVIAELIDCADNPVHIPVHFFSRISLAEEVYYHNEACPTLIDNDNVQTVQGAIETMSKLAIIEKYKGDSQEAQPGSPFPELLSVAVSCDCTPLDGTVVVVFPEGKGRVAHVLADLNTAVPGQELKLTNSSNGIYSFAWMPDPSLPYQQCRALLKEVPAGHLIRKPENVHFDGTVQSQAGGHGPYFDDLRADGVVLDPDGILGLEVTRTNIPNRVAYSSGIAYVAGNRFVINAGTVDIDMGSSPNIIVVDESGTVVIPDPKHPLPKCAVLAYVYPYEDRIIKIVDGRLDLTHLDEQVKNDRIKCAGTRTDRRAFIPLLGFTLKNLVCRDGRHHTFDLLTHHYCLAFDGDNIWAAGNKIISLFPKDAIGTTVQPTHIEDFDYLFVDIAFDSLSHMWCTATYRLMPNGELAQNNQVIAIDIKTHAYNTVQVGLLPISIAAGGQWMWVCNAGSSTISVINSTTRKEFQTISLSIPGAATLQPMRIVYDGEYMWVACFISGAQNSALFKIDKFGGKIQIDGIDGRINDLAFDGTHLWVTVRNAETETNEVILIDVISDTLERFPFPYAFSLVCDGSFIWVLTSSETKDVYKCDIGAVNTLRQIKMPGFPFFQNIIRRACVFDGTHFWITPDDQRVPRLHKLLVV